MTREIKKELIHILKMKKLFGMEHIPQLNFDLKENRINTLPSNIKDLETHVDNCSLCELSKIKESSYLGKGDVNSSIYLIGINYNFDLEKDFLMIKNMVEKVLNRNINDIYMTNIIKCNTSKIKADLKNEISTCISYIQRQIDITNPKIIITLGDAFQHFIKNNDDMIDVSGNKFSYKEILLLPLMDPSFINKNPSYKEKMFKDLKKIKKIMDEK